MVWASFHVALNATTLCLEMMTRHHPGGRWAAGTDTDDVSDGVAAADSCIMGIATGIATGIVTGTLRGSAAMPRK